MSDLERVLETFRAKLDCIRSDNKFLPYFSNRRRDYIEFACEFAVETIENMDIKETCKWKAWDHSFFTSDCKMTWAHDIEHDHPKEWMKYCPKCGKIAEIETYTEDEDA